MEFLSDEKLSFATSLMYTFLTNKRFRYSFKKIQNIPNTSVGKLLNILKYFNGKSIKPIYLMLDLTHRCNLNCEYCHSKEALNRKSVDFSIGDIELLHKNIQDSYLLNKPRIHLFGGEPTVNKYFLEIINFLNDKGYKISFTTNGILLPKLVDELSGINGIKTINISINKKNIEKIVEINKITETIRLKKKYEIVINIPTDFIFVNKIDISELINRFSNDNISSVCILHSTTILKDKRVFNLNTIFNLFDNIKNNRINQKVDFFPNIKWKDIKKYYYDLNFPSLNIQCLYPWLVMKIQPTGEVIPCPTMVNNIMGNIKKSTISEIWGNNNFRKFRNYIKENNNGSINSFCLRCPFRQYY